MKRLLISALVFCAAAANIQDTIDLGYSKYKGVSLTNGITQWQGIRYAAPPIGNLRFAPPQDPEYVAEVQLADTVCHQYSTHNTQSHWLHIKI